MHEVTLAMSALGCIAAALTRGADDFCRSRPVAEISGIDRQVTDLVSLRVIEQLREYGSFDHINLGASWPDCVSLNSGPGTATSRLKDIVRCGNERRI